MQGRVAVNRCVCQPGLIGIKALKTYAESDRISQVLERTNFCPLLILGVDAGKKKALRTDRPLVIPLMKNSILNSKIF